MDLNQKLDEFSRQQLIERLAFLKDTKPEVFKQQLMDLDQYGFFSNTNKKSQQSLVYYSTIKVNKVEIQNKTLVEQYVNEYLKMNEKSRGKMLKQICRLGVPNNYRKFIWQQALQSHLDHQQDRDSFYEQLLGEKIENQVIIQINKDIDRTMPQLQFFANISILSALFRILKAYASFDTHISYCQGMGFLAAIFLYYMPEVDAFYAFKAHMTRFNNMYQRDMKGTHLRCAVFSKLIKQLNPEIDYVFQLNSIDYLFSAPWFMTLFSYSLNFNVLVRVLDMIFCEGEKALFRPAIAMLQRSAKGVQFKLNKLKFNSDQHSTQFEKFLKELPKIHDNISILSMPEIDCRLALQGIGFGINDPDLFIQECLNVKFKTKYLIELSHKCEKDLK